MLTLTRTRTRTPTLTLTQVCAARATSLADLPHAKHRELRRLGVTIDVDSAVQAANRQLQTLIGEGHAPDAHTYLGLLRVAAGAADVPRAQAVMTRMLDSDVMPTRAHFHALLRACVRGQRHRPGREDEHLQVASMARASI